MLDVRRLRLLRELAHRGTITAVADALAYTPSAVSQQLSVLEREAGLPLLERTGRRVTLTPAAWNLVRHAEAVLERLEQADADLAGARRGLAGSLRIGAFPSAGRAMIPAALTALARQHPGLAAMITEIDPAAVSSALRAGDLDVALIHEYDFAVTDPEPGVSTEALCAEPLYLVEAWDVAVTADGTTARDGVVGGGAVRAMRDVDVTEGVDVVSGNVAGGNMAGGNMAQVAGGLACWRDAPWITATPGTMCQRMTVRACQAAGFTPRVRHQVDDFATTLALAAAGQGVALVPELGLADAPPGLALTPVPLRRRTLIACRSGAGRHPAVTALTAALRSAVPAGLATGGT